MKIYKCLFSGAEVLCDNDKNVPEEGIMFKMPGRYIEIGGDDCGIAANVDEDADEGAVAEGTENQKQKVIDIVHHNRLTATSFDKAGYMAYIKGYLKNLVAHLQGAGASEDDIRAFQQGAQTFIRSVVASFDDWEFYYPDGGDSMDYDTCMVILVKWEGEGVDQFPVFHYFKDGLKGEKV